MSLTSILSSSEHRELKDQLREYFPRPDFSLTGEILAEPQSKNYSTVGGAFDYLLRFHLERININKVIKRDRWIALNALERLKALAEVKKRTKNKIDKFEKYMREQYSKQYFLVKNKYDEAEKRYFKFVENGILTDDLIISTIFLAKLDAFFRAGVIDDNIERFEVTDVEDLRKLISLVPFSNFTAIDKCYFNPTFGEGSIMVGGADADVIIDDTLYDFKVTKYLKLEREQLNQIIGYYVLSEIGGINEDREDKPIKNIGVYFARHGVVLKFSIADFNTAERIDEFINWFVLYMRNNSPYGFLSQDFEKIMKSLKVSKNNLRKKSE